MASKMDGWFFVRYRGENYNKRKNLAGNVSFGVSQGSVLAQVMVAVYVIPPSHTRIFLEFLRIAHIHGSLWYSHFYDRFKSCYELLRAIYGLLQIITMYLRKKIHDLLRGVTDNYEQLTGILWVFMDCYEYITECYYSSKFLCVSYDLFTCCYE